MEEVLKDTSDQRQALIAAQQWQHQTEVGMHERDKKMDDIAKTHRRQSIRQQRKALTGSMLRLLFGGGHQKDFYEAKQDLSQLRQTLRRAKGFDARFLPQEQGLSAVT